MSILRQRRREIRSADTLAELLAQARGGPTWAGPYVGTDQAMRLSAVWSCVKLYADVVSTLPLQTFRDGSDGPIRVPDPPLIARPSGTVDRIGWLRQNIVSELLRGNVFGLIQSVGPNGWPTQIESVNPETISCVRKGSSGPVEWQHLGKPIQRWPLGPLWHLPVNLAPGSPLGMSTIEYARQTVGLGLGALEHGARWFGDGAHPSAILSTDKEVDKDTATIVKQRFVDSIRGRREPAVLGLGLKYEQVQVSAEDSQFLATIQANREQVVGMFFPHTVLAQGASMTYANVESRTLDMLVFDIQPMLVRYERALSDLLPAREYVRFNTGALVRTTLKERFEAHAIAISNGWRSVNETRALEEEQAIGPQGDTYLWPPKGVTTPTQEKP